jgi:large repetitive protein
MTLHTPRRIASIVRATALAIGALVLINSDAAAQQTVNLVAAPVTKSVSLPNGTTLQVPMWGFAIDANNNGLLDGAEAATVPGPRITVAPGTTALVVKLTNLLPEPASVVILGQQASGSPTVNADGRIRAMAPEAGPGGGTATYNFSNLKPGTFLYESGSHQAVQVQMGLYGAVTVDSAANQAYPPGANPADTGVTYSSEMLLLYSEIDVALHNAVAAGTYGNPLQGPTSTIDFDPSIFLLNGESYTVAQAPIAAGATGQRTLVRMLNAGLATHVTVIDNAALTIVAEDGNRYADPKTQASVLMPAGKTHDVIWAPSIPGDYTVYDRTLRLEALDQAVGGMLARVHVNDSAGGGSPNITALPDTGGTAQGAVLNGTSVLTNDTTTTGTLSAQLFAQPAGGTVVLNANGTYTYTPRPNFAGVDAFWYQATNGTDTSTPTVVMISVSLVQAAPTAFPLSLGVDTNGSKPVTLSASDPNGDPVTYYLSSLPAHGTAILGTPAKIGISSITAGNPATVTTTAPHHLTTGQAIIISGTSADPSVNGNRAVTVTGPTTFTIAMAVTTGQGAAGGLLDTIFRRPLVASDLFVSASQPGTSIPAGTLVYQPTSNYAGADTFSFLAGDGVGGGAGNVSSPAAVSISVQAVTAAAASGVPVSLTVLGVDPRSPQASQPVSSYRWTLEEDRTYAVQPGALDPETPAVNFHKSYMPVVQSGDETTQPLVDPDTVAQKRYFISVLPKNGGYSNGGAPIAFGQSAVTVYVDKTPLPTAQLRVRVFQDNSPLNNQFDADELPLAGFNVGLDDAGGRYGIAGGQMMQDAFGNPIGTTYKPCSTGPGTCDSYEVDTLGNGFLITDAQGFVTFQNLRPGKYTAKVIPPAGQNWQQTTTIEGQKGQDAWVKANEPTFFQEFGPAGPHVEIGFVKPTNALTAGTNRRTITGTITNLHQSRPPDFTMFSGAPFDFTRAWVALNEGTEGSVVYAGPTNEDGTFEIPNVPDGGYTLAIWDSALDVIFASKAVTVAGGNVALGDIPVFSWFTRIYHYVFEDTNKNGIRDAGERGIREVPLNVRWRDASIHLSSATDGSGFLPFEEAFPFFAWQIAEVDYGRFRATGVTTVVDNGGNPATDTTWSQDVQAINDGGAADPRVLAPQPQVFKPGVWGSNEQPMFGGRARTETGIALLEGFQGFVGQTNVFLWGKAPYDVPGSHPTDINVAPFDDFPGPGDTDWNGNGKFDVDEFNGGITGIVHYSTTRAENNARWGTPEPWEPGIAGVTVQLWDESRTHLLNEVQTDSWDDKIPTGCQGDVFSYLGKARDCYDGMRNWNQVRPAVFDGGYAFYTIKEPFVDAQGNPLPLDQRTTERPLPAANYVVKVVVPRGYELVKEEDKNVDFGDEYVPQQFYLSGYPLADAAPTTDAQPRPTVVDEQIWAPFCVGRLHTVPGELSLFPGVPGAYAGDQLPLCDEKMLVVKNGMNAAANFFLFTQAPVAGHIIGFVLDDASNEFDPNSPQFGEKYAPPWLPVSIRDWTGREISRTYTDRYGVYNALVPSTYTASTPIPSGMTPSMLTACINSPLKADGTADPFYNKQYSQFCYTLQYMPGTTTYLDTPVVPTGAFAGPGQATLDSELPDKTPVIYSVTQGTNPTGGIGPYIVDGTPAQRTISIKSSGLTAVDNPAFDNNLPNGAGNPKLVNRDYGFGTTAGQVWVGSTLIPAANVAWGDAVITAQVPAGTPTGQLKVVRCIDGAACTDKRPSVMGVTLTVAGVIADALKKPATVAAGSSIQSAVDAAAPGDLILVAPGTYDEMVIMDKPVRLQGWGAPATIINAVKTPAEKLQAWRDRVTALLTANPSYLLAFQNTELTALLPPDQTGEVLGPVLGGEGAAVTVLARDFPILGVTCPQILRPLSPQAFGLQLEGLAMRSKARIDGFGITGSDQAAGIEVNANACNLEVLNNRVYSNTGDFGGGVRVGHPGAVPDLADEAAHNDYVRIAFNHVLENSSFNYDAGGGIAIGTGATYYSVNDNFIAGNFTFGRGAGIAHIGLSTNGTIDHNTIVFNEVFNQDSPREGGGIYVGGRLPAAAELTPGAGNVVVSNNLVQGNAAIGDGGGIALSFVNGAEGSANRYRVDLFGNTIVNNVAGLAGGGISLQDAVNVRIYHDTVAHNDSLAVAGAAFPAGPNQSTPQPAGIVSRNSSVQLVAAGGSNFSNPAIRNSIVWENRTFSFGPCPAVQDPAHPCSVNLDGTATNAPKFGLIPTPAGTGHPLPYYWDFGVIGATGSFNMAYSVATSLAGVTTGTGTNNSTTGPVFVRTYFNGDRRQTIQAPDIASAIPVPAVFDEGGNFIRPMFGPLTLNHLTDGLAYGDYHVPAGVDGQPLYSGQITGGPTALFTSLANVPTALRADADGDSRVTVSVYPNRGADQKSVPPPPPLPTLSINDVSVTEGNSGTQTVNFTVTLSAASASNVTVAFATANGPLSGGAFGGGASCNPNLLNSNLLSCDFVNTSGTLTFTPGQTTKTISVTIKGDTRAELNEIFYVNLTNPAGATTAKAQGVGTIVNND